VYITCQDYDSHSEAMYISKHRAMYISNVETKYHMSKCDKVFDTIICHHNFRVRSRKINVITKATNVKGRGELWMLSRAIIV
jgi:hypothetical protein